MLLDTEGISAYDQVPETVDTIFFPIVLVSLTHFILHNIEVMNQVKSTFYHDCIDTVRST